MADKLRAVLAGAAGATATVTTPAAAAPVAPAEPPPSAGPAQEPERGSD